jgi:hypothetical protein
MTSLLLMPDTGSQNWSQHVDDEEEISRRDQGSYYFYSHFVLPSRSQTVSLDEMCCYPNKRKSSEVTSEFDPVQIRKPKSQVNMVHKQFKQNPILFQRAR